MEWGVLLTDSLPLSLLTSRPLSMVLGGVSGEDMLSLGSESSTSSDSVSKVMRRVECVDADVSLGLLRSLIDLSVANVSAVRSHQCGSDTWSVLRCPQSSSSASSLSSYSLSSSVLLCVNCSNDCISPPPPSSSSSSSSLTISCSDASSTSSPFGELTMLFVSFGELFVAPTILSQSAKSSRDNITVTASLSGSGSMVCGAYEIVNENGDSGSPSSSEELILGGTPVSGVSISSSNEFSGSYTLMGLIPSSSYNVFCATVSPSSVPMSRVDMLRSRMLVETRCCRLLEVRLNRLLFDDVSDIPFALTVDVGSGKVLGRVTVMISVIPAVDVSTLSSHSNSTSISCLNLELHVCSFCVELHFLFLEFLSGLGLSSCS